MNRNERIIEAFKKDVERIVESAEQHELKEAVGMLKDPKNFDPDDPEIIVSGFGTWTRSALRMGIVNRLEGLVRAAKTAANTEGPAAYKMYQNLRNLLDPKSGVIFRMIEAELDAADELEAIRVKGGRRNFVIPKQK